MPQIRYTIEIDGDVFSETVLIKRGDAQEFAENLVITPMNRRRTMFNEPLASLVKVEVLDPYTHLHEWQFTYHNKSNLRSYYVCKYCEATGFIRLDIGLRPTAVHVTRDDKYVAEKWDVCRDQLKKGPKKLCFG